MLDLGNNYLSLRCSDQAAKALAEQYLGLEALLKNGEKPLTLEEKLAYQEDLARAYLGLSQANLSQKDYLVAIDTAKQAEKVYQDLQKQSGQSEDVAQRAADGEARASQLLGNAYLNLDRFDEGFKSLNQMLKLSRDYIGEGTKVDSWIEKIRLVRAGLDILVSLVYLSQGWR